MKLLTFGNRRIEQTGDRLELALHSLRARGVVETFQRFAPATFRLQWERGNFGLELKAVHGRRGWDLGVTPLCAPAGAFAGNPITGEIASLGEWVRCGERRALEHFDRMSHVALVDWLRGQESGHPAAEWLAEQFRRLARGERPAGDDLQSMVLLGARRFVKTIPGADRLHEAIEPALVTLLAMNAGWKGNDTGAIVAGEDYGRALIGFLQETHPLEVKRAAFQYAKAR